MAKTVHNDILDAALNYIKTNALIMTACSAQPTTYAEAITTYKLADIVIDSDDFTGPADGDTNGRKLTVNAQNGVTVDTEGNPTHIALADTVNGKLLYVTTETGLQTLYAGNTCNFPAWDIEIADPT
jgi:hypothetical protein